MYSVVACLDTYNHYPAKPFSRIDIKLYFFQIVKERNSNDLEKIKPKSDDLRLSFLVEDDGIEPTTPCLQSRCSPS